jgi:uncharacterized protein
VELSDKILQFELDDLSTLLINPATGAIDIAPNQILETMPESGREHLEKRGYFFSENDRAGILKSLQDTYEQHSKNVPYWFYVLTTLNCNFGCPICYEKKSLENSEATLEKIDDIVSSIADFQQEHGIPDKRMNLIIFGGEPLCVSTQGIVREILESSARHGWKDVIVTNGSRVSRFIDLFTEYSSTIFDFRITLDGPKAVHDARRPYRGGKGSFSDVVQSIDLLLEKLLPVKMQTILGAGNLAHFEDLITFVREKEWLQNQHFQWRIEGSHDYANLDPEKDEVSEGKIVRQLISSWQDHKELQGKLKFESFKYLGHIVRSFGWLGKYKTYWGPKLGFCEPQKGFHYVFSTDGNIYHCPRTISNPDFAVGLQGIANNRLKRTTILEKEDCLPCSINTLCGGGCVVQKKYAPGLDCKEHAYSVISEFISMMTDQILARAKPDKIVQINELW